MVLVCVAIALLAPKAAAQTFYESGGLIVVEVESVAPTGDWVEESAIGGYTGSGYYRWNGPLLLNDHSQGVMAYSLHVTNAGTYNLRIRSHHPPGDQYNDCWTSVDGGTWTKTYASAPAANDWVWYTQFDKGGSHPEASYYLSAGLHTFYVSGRAPQFSIDRIHLFLDGVAGGTDPGQPQSSTSGSGGTGGSGGGTGGSGGAPPSGTLAVESFTLVNADTDGPIDTWSPLQDGAVLNLATLPAINLNVQANVSAQAGSVRFDYDGAQVRVENGAPYALGGDNGQGDFYAWTPSLGQHTLSATPFTGPDASGVPGIALTISFSVVDEPGQAPEPDAGAPPTPDAGSDAQPDVHSPPPSKDPDDTGWTATGGTSGAAGASNGGAAGSPVEPWTAAEGSPGCALRSPRPSTSGWNMLALALVAGLLRRSRRDASPSLDRSDTPRFGRPEAGDRPHAS